MWGFRGLLGGLGGLGALGAFSRILGVLKGCLTTLIKLGIISTSKNHQPDLNTLRGLKINAKVFKSPKISEQLSQFAPLVKIFVKVDFFECLKVKSLLKRPKVLSC